MARERLLAFAVIGLTSVACFGKIAPEPSDGGPGAGDGQASGEGGDGDGGGGDGGNGGRGIAPTPNCTGESTCLPSGPGYTGGVAVTCDPVSFVGPWTLLLERQVGANFQTVEVKDFDKPGFGATLEDTNAPQVTVLTYRVCTTDDFGTRCAAPFTTRRPPSCKCVPFTCETLNVCGNGAVSDGCGVPLLCGDCPPGSPPCNPTTRSCCGPGLMSDGVGGCVCAPPHRCPPRSYWDTRQCACVTTRRPLPDPPP
jgi:hypothetical protein